MIASLSKIRSLLSLNKVTGENLTEQLRARRKIGTEEMVAAVLLTASLLEKYKHANCAKRTFILHSVPVPLAPPRIVPHDNNVEHRKEISHAELSMLNELVKQVFDSVTISFLVRMMQTKNADTEILKAHSINRASLMILREISIESDIIFTENAQAYIDTFIAVAFSGTNNAAVVPLESVECILSILKNICVSWISCMQSANSKRNFEYNAQMRNKVLMVCAKIMNCATSNHTAFPTSVLHTIVLIYNYHHDVFHKATLCSSLCEKSIQNEKILEHGTFSSAEAKVHIMVSVSHQSSMCLRLLIMQGLHGYASDHIRDTTLQACYFLLKECIDMTKAYELNTDVSDDSKKYESLVPVLWSVEPDDGTNVKFSHFDDAGSVDLHRSSSGKLANSCKDGDNNKSGSPPVGQFAVFLISIVRTELRISFQQALTTLNDIDDESKVSKESGDDMDRLLRRVFTCASVFDQMLVLLAGNDRHTIDNDDDEDPSAIWANLPFIVITRIRQYVHSIIKDMLEFIAEAAVIMQAQSVLSADILDRGFPVSFGNKNTRLSKLASLCSRISRSVSLWVLEDEDLLVPILSGLHSGSKVLNGKSSESLDSSNCDMSGNHFVIESTLFCSSLYYATIEDTIKHSMTTNFAHKDIDSHFPLSTSGTTDECLRSKPVLEFRIEECMNLSRLLCGNTLPAELTEEDRKPKYLNYIGSNTTCPDSRFIDHYDRYDMDINYNLEQGDILQYFLPIFYSIAQTESQGYQEHDNANLILLPWLVKPGCEFTAVLLKLVKLALFTSRSTMVTDPGVSRLYSSGAVACDMLSIILEYYMTEHNGTLSQDSIVLGSTLFHWTNFLYYIQKPFVYEDRLSSADSDVLTSVDLLKDSIIRLKDALALLMRCKNLL